MRFLNPVGFFALLLALPILALYFLRLHRQQVTVPSTLLWAAVLLDHHANRPWQKLRRNWLLILQLLTLLALILALARPALPLPLAFQGHVVVLLDGSASMQAVRLDGRTRFDAALHELSDLAGTLDRDESVTLIVVGPEPVALVQTGDAAALRRALSSAAPADGAANWEAAAALAAGMASGAEVTTLLITDAAVADSLPALPGTVRLISVGEPASNVGIAAFALRRASDGMTAFVRLSNDGPAARRLFSLYVDGVLFARREVTLPADEAVSLSFDSLPPLSWAEARLDPDAESGEPDAFALDDRAWVAPAQGSGERVLLVTPGNRFLDQALRSLQGVQIEHSRTLLDDGTAATAGEAPSATPAVAEVGGYGLIVTDGVLTGTLPASGGLWLIAPGAGTACGEPGDLFTPTTAVQGQWTHSLLQYVDWSEVHVARARSYAAPADAEILLKDAGGPLLWLLDRPGQRVACLAFDLHDSDLPLRTAFPLLTANLVGWLLPQTSAAPIQSFSSGQLWSPSLPPETESATLVTPEGKRLPLLDAEGRASLPPTQAGLYRIEIKTEAEQLTRYAALSLLDETESDLRPRSLLIDGVPLSTSAVSQAGWRELSVWPLVVALVLLFLEAFVWWNVQPRVLASRLSQITDRQANGSVRWMARLRDYGAALRRSLPRVGSPAALIGRLLLVLGVILALLDVRWTRSTRDLATVFLLDRSASTQGAWESAVAFVEDSLAEKGARDRAAVVVFGADAWVDRGFSVASGLDAVATFPRADATDIEEAVRLALALIPSGAPGRLVLLTDGLATAGRAENALRESRLQGVDLLVAQMGETSTGPEVWLEGLRLPTQVYPGDRVAAAITVGGEGVPSAGLAWTAGRQSGQDVLRLSDTRDTFLFSFVAESAGFMPVRACIEGTSDTFSQNNCVSGWLVVQGAPRVLVVGDAVESEALVAALRQAGITVESCAPADLPPGVQGLAGYAAVIVVNTPAREFSPQALAALQAFVRDLGGGLVAVGGAESYGVGGWLGTPLEEILPVSMQVRDPRRFPPLAMAVVIDKSGSMSAEESGIPKIRLAAEAATRVAETLNDTDTLAVVAYDDRPADTIGPVAMVQRDEVMDQLLRLQAGGGGIYMRESLAYAADLLREVPEAEAQQRHILMLADGSDAEQQEGTLDLAAELRAEGMTISVVSIGIGPDVPFLTQLARVGEGRFYLTQYAADLPAIFAEEAAQAKRSYIVEEPFYPDPVSTWEPLQGLLAVPPLQGYVATTPKERAQVVWEATQDDPLLAAWQYGLGRTVAWTSDATGRWAAGWVSWEDFSRFWGNLVRWVFPPPSATDVALQVQPSGEQALVAVDVVAADGGYVDDLDMQIQVAQPGDEERSQEVALRQVAPGRYEGQFTPSAPGAWLLRLHGDRALTTGWARPYSAEYLPGDSAEALAQLAAWGGGQVVEEPAAAFVHNLQGRETGQPLAPWLILVVTLFWPVDIAWRRLALSRADVARLFNRLRGWVRGKRSESVPAPQEAPTLAASLRARRRLPVEPRPAAPVTKTEAIREGPVSVPLPRQAPSSEGRPPSAPASGEEESMASRLKRRIKS